MAESIVTKSEDPFNFQPITCSQIQYQSRLVYKAFQYLIKPSWQLAIAEVFLSAIPLIAFFFVSNLSYNDLIVIGYGMSICNMVGVGFSYASSLTCEDEVEKEDDLKKAVTATQRGFLCTLCTVCLPVWAVWLNADSLIKGLKQEPDLSRRVEEYCLTFIPALPSAVPSKVYFSDKAGAILSIGLNAIFVKVLKLGVRGGAIATILAYFCIALVLVIVIIWNKKYKEAWPGWSWGCFLAWERFGLKLLPYMLWVIAEWWTLDVGIYVVGTLDAFNRRLGSQITISLVIRFLSIIADRFAAEASDQIKEAVDAKYNRRAVFLVKCSVLIIWVSSFFCGFLLISLPKIIPSSFTNDRPFGLSVTEMIIVVSAIPFLKGTQALGFHVVRKLKSRYLNVIIVLIGNWVFGLPIGLCLVYLRSWGMRGFWAGYSIGILIQAMLFLVILKDFMQEWTLAAERKPKGPPTPSGILSNGSDETDGDGSFYTTSLLLGEPRINHKFNPMTVIDEEDGKEDRPSTVRIALTALASFFFCAILIVGIVIKAAGIGQ
eukprot:gene1448-15873_t